MMRTIVALIAALLVVSWNSATAEKMYKWVDEQGKVSYHDRPPPTDSRYRVEEKQVRTGPGSTDSGNANKAPVVLYAVPKCATCDLVRQHLKRRNVPYVEKNVETDVKLQEELKTKAGVLAVPVVLIGSKVLNNYSAGWLDSELTQAGYSGGAAAAADGEKQAEKTTDDGDSKAPSE